MKVSAISQSEDCTQRRNLFIRYSNSFMSMPLAQNPYTKAISANPEPDSKPQKLGIENLQEFTIFPKQVVDGKTVITA